MIPVTVVDVIPQQKGDREAYAVVLLDEAARRVLPIWIGQWEAESIALGLIEASLPRPMTYDFIAKLLKAVGAELEDVRIEALKDFTFYAVAKLRSADKVREVDARPSDAIALALHMNSPIYVAQDLLEQQGIDVPAKIDKQPLGKGLDCFRHKREQKKQDNEQWLQKMLASEQEQTIQGHQELITFLFDSG
jgi:bifunctional DNase/RNase